MRRNMTKYEFLGDLSRLLKDLPEEERKQALHYYEDYFADAGEDNEQEVLNELGSPENVSGNASDVTPDSTQNDRSQSDNNWHSMTGDPSGNQHMNGDSSGNQQSNTGYTNGSASHSNASGANQSTCSRSSGLFSGMDNTNLIIMIIVLVVTSPIWGSALLGIASFLLGLLGALVGIFAALVLGGGGSAISGIVAIVAGFIALFAGHAASGVLTIGVGCLLFSLGSAFCYLGVFLAIRLIPLLWRQLGRLWDWCRIKLLGKEASC